MNLDGPVRVADTAGSGSASVTLSFDAWTGAKVAPTTHAVEVRPAKKAPPTEPVAEALVATLVHPDRKAGVSAVAFSADGTRLFVAGYPSGVVQIFDVAGRKELRRIDTPPGSRGSATYALLAPDWKTLYVPTEKSKVTTAEVGGKKVTRVEESGTIRVWDVATGEERAALRPPVGGASDSAWLSPDGKALVSVERLNFDTGTEIRSADVTAVWDLATATRRKIADGYQTPTFTPDGKSLVLGLNNRAEKTSTLRVFDAATLKELARLDCPEMDRGFLVSAVSPDGAVLAVTLYGKKGAPREVWFRDAKTLADRGRFVGEGDPDRYGWGELAFTPDGNSCVILGLPGKVVVWDVAGKKVTRTFDVGGATFNLTVSPDGKTVAVPWAPPFDTAERARDPDPQDHPQPRVTLYDLAGATAPRTLVCRHGFLGPAAFSPDGKALALGTSGGTHLFDLTK